MLGTVEQRQEVGRHAVAGIHHVGITVADLERSLEFYASVLGLPVIAVSEPEEVGSVVGVPGARARFADLDAGNGQVLELAEYETRGRAETPGDRGSPRDVSQAGSSHVSLVVGDLAATLESLADQGTQPIGATAQLSGGIWDGCSVVYLRDPDGMVVELLERGRDDSADTPADVPAQTQRDG